MDSDCKDVYIYDNDGKEIEVIIDKRRTFTSLVHSVKNPQYVFVAQNNKLKIKKV